VRSLNLATRPFRNERLPSLLAVLSLAGMVLLTAYHVLLVRDVMPDRTSALTVQLAEMEAESARLRTEGAGLRGEKPDAATLAQWTRLKEMVDRRVFSWSGLFAVLEDTLPDGVRLVSLTPKVEKGQVTLQIHAVARTFDEALVFMRALEERPEFSSVWPTTRGSGPEGVEYQYEMTYLPQPHKAAAPPAPAQASSADPGPSAAVASARAVVEP
jgi:Tfp pilus assembly protein PilN